MTERPERAGGDAARPPWPAVDVVALPWPGGRALDLVGLAAVAVVGAVLRVLQRSPLWLDEALSSNIAALPIRDIPDALRHDGHPPLYYVVLHVWQDLVGDGDVAVRLLSGLAGLVLLPLAFVAAGRLGGRRAAWAATLLVALNPYVLRYSTEARMYEIVMVLALGGWLVADRALRQPTVGRLVGLAVLTGALLWTHYWGVWLTLASGLGVLARAAHAHRAGATERRRSSLLVAGALVAGGLLFLPWVPTLLYQSAHTGTPWAEPSLPPEVLATSLVDLGGGTAGEAVLLTMALVVLAALGLAGAPGRGTIVEIDLRTRPPVRRLAFVVAATLLVAGAASYVADAAYATRYFSVVAPLVLVLAGVGVARIGGPLAFRVALAVVLVLGAVSGLRAAITNPRSQSREVARAIEAAGPVGADGPLVLVCPDQLGPALGRELPDDADIATFPRFERPELVDWVDYAERLAQVTPEAFVAEALERGAGRDIWLVWSGTYSTHQGTCETVANELQRARPAGVPVVLADPDAFEQANAIHFPEASG